MRVGDYTIAMPLSIDDIWGWALLTNYLFSNHAIMRNGNLSDPSLNCPARIRVQTPRPEESKKKKGVQRKDLREKPIEKPYLTLHSLALVVLSMPSH